MEVGGSSNDHSRKVVRRTWTKDEEEALLPILEDVVGRGQRSDIGSFKSGTITMIESFCLICVLNLV